MYKWSALNNVILPTTKQAIDAMSKADQVTAAARDQRNLMSALMRLPRAIPRIAGNLQTRRTALSSFSWDIVPLNADQQEDANKVKLRVAPCCSKIVSWHTDVPAYGASIVQLSAFATVNGMTLDVLKRYAPTEIERPVGISNPSELCIVDQSKQTRTISPLSELMAEARQSYLADIDDNYEPGGVLRALLLKAITAVTLEKEWMNTAKKIKGIIETVYAQDATTEEVGAAVAAVQDAATKNIVAHSNDIELNWKDISNAGNAVNTFNVYLQMLNNDFSIALLGQANTTQLPNNGGSRAALQILQMITADIIYSDIIRVERMMNTLLLYDYQLNKDINATSTPWTFKFIIPEEVNLESRARVVQTLLASNIPLLASEVYSSMQFSNPDPTVTTLGEIQSVV
jgi:phage gp29-like protein